MFKFKWTKKAGDQYKKLANAANKISKTRKAFSKKSKSKKKKPSKQAGLFKQVYKALNYLKENPSHQSLQTHEYSSLGNPYDKNGKVFEAYAQNRTPGAYRIFWCYGPKKGEITIIAITPHP